MKLEITMHPVKSSNVAALGYHEPSKTLRVEFKGGKAYDYAGVERKAFEALRDAHSVGGHFAAHIRDAYPTTKVAPKEHGHGE